jgi:hypothetical protein
MSQKIFFFMILFCLTSLPFHASAIKFSTGLGPQEFPNPLGLMGSDSVLISGLHIRNHTDLDVETPIRWFCKKFGIENAYIRVSYFESPDKPFLGILTHQVPNVYFIKISRRSWSAGAVLMHELVHVRQYYTGELSQQSHSKLMYMGRQIDLHEVSYAERKYEQAALSEGNSLWKAFRKEKKSGVQPKSDSP